MSKTKKKKFLCPYMSMLEGPEDLFVWDDIQSVCRSLTKK